MKLRLCAALAALAFASTGCFYYQAPVMPPPGLMFSSTAAPLDIDADKTPVCSKMGESRSSAFLFNMFAFGDCSIDTAARNGNLQVIEHADYHHLNIMFMYQRFTVRAYGN